MLPGWFCTDRYPSAASGGVPGRERPITQQDIDRAVEEAQALNLPTNREILHVVPRFFVVDGQEQVSDPVGMYGQRLDMETHIVSGSLTAVQNLTQCVEGAGVQVEALVLSPMAAAQAVLEEEEKRQGIIVADIGGGTTGIAVFVDGAVFHTSVLPVGGYHLTHDLVAGLRAPFSAVSDAGFHVVTIPALRARRESARRMNCGSSI